MKMKMTPVKKVKKLVSAKRVRKKVVPKNSPVSVKKLQKSSKKQIVGAAKDIAGSSGSFTIVAIGASAGGLEAISQLLRNLPADTGMAYIYVQHLSPDHKSMLTALLSKTTKMKVQDVENMDKMQPNNVYIIPYNKGIKVTNGHIRLIPRTGKSATLSIDVLFRSLAETHKDNVIGIVLSGSGSDGTLGLKEIKSAGGITFAQDDSAKFSSMPISATTAGAVDFILSPKEIALKLAWMSTHPLIRRKGIRTLPEDEIDNNDPDLRAIINQLNVSKNVDFGSYKLNTIKRRLLRRMLFHKISSLSEYAILLKHKAKEVEYLYQDMLINVTEFFRDPEAFLQLKKTILPRLLKTKSANEPLRIWVAACATGEEAYSIAMLLYEIMDNKTQPFPFQIFASDLSADAIHQARIGEYSKQQLKNVSTKRLQRFFTKAKEKYRITKSLRDVCIFAQHNILRDPPFSKMDLITCRNMLIYLDPPAQKRAISTFHYALNDSGSLLLGKSETIGPCGHLFIASLSKKYKIFTRKKDSEKIRTPELLPQKMSSSLLKMQTKHSHSPAAKVSAHTGSNTGTSLDAFLLEKHSPASVVINHEMEILQFRGATSLFLRNPEGKASLNILKMAKPEVIFELRNAIHNAIKTKKAVRKSGVEMRTGEDSTTSRVITIEVSPLKVETEENLLAVVFTVQEHIEVPQRNSFRGSGNSAAKDRRILKLEEEIASARIDMASITQDQEAANEELQSANEEIVSSNEELQSLNEELETSKEEIESTNEELITTNQELQTRNQQVEELYTYYETILSAIHEPMLILHNDMRIRSANKSFCKLFRMTEDSVLGNSLFKIGEAEWNIPRLRVLLLDIVPNQSKFQDFEVELNLPVIGKKTLLLNAHQIKGKGNGKELIVLTIADVTQMKKLSTELQRKELKVMEVKLATEKKSLKKIEIANNELEIAKKDAEQKSHVAQDAVKAKQRFLANMSHEIRTPMNAIIGFTNVVLKTKLDEAQREYLNAIKVSGDALIILINDILDLAKVDAGKMIFEKTVFNLSQSISSMVHLFEPKLKEKNLHFSIDFDPSIPELIVGDSLRFRQIFLNLFSNAVKFTNAGKVDVSVKLLKQDSEEVSISCTVVDTGIGIPEDRLEMIFNSFEQAGRDTSRSYGGSGLGLAISKQLVELQGGQIFVSSTEALGSTFGFTLSFLRADPRAKKIEGVELLNKELKREANSEKIKVLIVEDVALNQLLLKIILADFGFEYDIANNGKFALDFIKEQQYDVILMDLQMPVMNGFEATAHIRNVLGSKVPIIALTADVTAIDVEKCMKVGMNDYISKPINEKLLHSKILKCIAENRELTVQ